MEYRMTTHTGVRLEERDDTPPVIVGLGAVYYRADDPGTEYELLPDLVERVMPGAFDQVLKDRPDIVGLYNHDGNYVLGRTVAGTLRLRDTSQGLAYELDPPETTTGRNIVESLRRGDVRGSSYAFLPKSEKWIDDGDRVIRELHEVAYVRDVGPVTFPAFTATTSGVRSAGDDVQLLDGYAVWVESKGNEAETIAIRRRIAEINTRFERIRR